MRALTSRDAQFALRFSLLIAFATAAVNAVLGTYTAYVLSRYRFRRRAAARRSSSISRSRSRRSSSARRCCSCGGRSACSAACSSRSASSRCSRRPACCSRTSSSRFRTCSAPVKPVLDEIEGTYEEAAYTIGASRWQAFRWVILPALRGGLFSGALLTFAHSLGEFGATVLVSGQPAAEDADGSPLHLRAVRGRQRRRRQRGRRGARGAVVPDLLLPAPLHAAARSAEAAG